MDGRKKHLAPEDRKRLLILSLCFLLGQLIFSMHTSPLYPGLLGGDSAIFSLLGKGLLAGKELYLDLFDHKGPFIFFINALGYFIGGRTGLFLLQCVAGLISLWLIYFTVKMLRPDGLSAKMTAVIWFAGLAYFFYTFEGGNLTEEYSLPLICWAMYLLCKYAVTVRHDPAHPLRYAFVYGVCIAALAFFRLNNAVAVCAGVLVVFIYLIIRKEYKNLLLNLCAGVAGMAVVAIPVVVYFWSKSSLDEMIYATFLHNFQIFGRTSQSSAQAKPQILLILYAPMALGALLWVLHWRKNKKPELPDVLLGVVLVLSFAALWIANRFPHYFTVFVPVYILMLGRYLHFGNAKKLTAVALCGCVSLSLVGLLYYFYGKNFQSYFLERKPQSFGQTMQEDFKIIPPEERDSVICYMVGVDAYHHADILPCYKYYGLQENWAIINPQILDDFMEWAATEKPLWIVKEAENENAALDAILKSYYELQKSNEFVEFYRLKE